MKENHREPITGNKKRGPASGTKYTGSTTIMWNQARGCWGGKSEDDLKTQAGSREFREKNFHQAQTPEGCNRSFH